MRPEKLVWTLGSEVIALTVDVATVATNVVGVALGVLPVSRVASPTASAGAGSGISETLGSGVAARGKDLLARG